MLTGDARFAVYLPLMYHTYLSYFLLLSPFVYRGMLEVEQEKVVNLRKELSTAQGAVEAFAVFSTLTDLPGVSAVTLMELMSGRIMLQQRQLATAKAHAERSQAETRKLRRAIDAKTSSSNNGRRSESPSGGRPSPSSGLEGAEDIETLKKRYSGILRAHNMGNAKDGLQSGSRSRDESEDEGSDHDGHNDVEEDQDEDFFGDAAITGVNAWRPVDGHSKGIAFDPCTNRNAAQDRAADTSAMSALSLVVDGETTPQVLLDSLNAATMAQKLISQDSIIATLRAQLGDVQDSLVRAESVHTKEIDELEGKSRIDIDIAHRRLELLQANINEAKAEIVLLKEKNAELDAEVLNGQTRFFEAHPDDAHRGRGAGAHESSSSTSTAFEIAMLNAGADAGDMDTSSVMSGHGHRHANGASDAMNHHLHRGSFTEADRAELDRVKSLLKERTAQLRIVMDTLDAVQAEGTRPGFARAAGTRDYLSQSYGVGDVEGAEALFGLTGITGGPGGTGYSAQSASIEGPWGVTSLVKRVVELTADLTSQNAAMAMEERRALQLEKESQRKTRDIGQLQTLIKGHEDALAKMKLNLEALGNQLRDTDKRRHDEVGAMRIDNERLTAALRDAENEVAVHQVTIDELSRQIDLSEQVDQRQWLESVILKDAEICAKHVDAREQQKSLQRRVDGDGSKQERFDLRSLMPLLAPVKENLSNEAAAGGHLSVRDLVISLLAQWRDQVGPMSFVKASSHSHKESGKHSSLTKAEQRFYQRVCDLVTGANHRCSQAVDESRWADCERMKAELSLKVAQDRLRATVQQLQRYRKRAYACEKVARGDRKHIEKKETKLVSLMTRSVNEQRSKLTSLTNSLFSERKERQVTEISRVAERLELRRLQVKVAELEARGGPSLRGRDEALSGLDERIKTTEASMHAWFKVELPRLMGGLPMQEESMANYFDSIDQRSAASGYGGYGYASSSSGFPEGKDAAGNNGRSFFGSSSSFPISSHLGAVMGMDRSYALAQTLCACKAGQAVRDMQITGLKEKNYILKERNVELEMVLKRWRKDIDDTAVQLASLLPLSAINGSSGATNLRGPDGSVDKTERLAIQVEEWQRRSQDLEGTSIEMKAKLDRANSRLEEMAQLVDVLTSEGDNLKGESTRQLTRTRVDLENAHASELRSIRVTCEEEKRRLMEQLDALASIVEVARLSSVADAMSRGGKAGSYTKLVSSMKKMLDSREHGRRKQRDQVSFGNDNSDGLDVDNDSSDNDRLLGKQRDALGSLHADRRRDVGAGSDMSSSIHRQTQTAFMQPDPQVDRGLEEKLAKLTSELEVERTRHSAARSEVC